MAAEHNVKLTLDELIVVREVLTESRARLADVLSDSAMRAEITSVNRGAEGRKEWGDLQRRHALLDTAIAAL
jgi:hypothetical protein